MKDVDIVVKNGFGRRLANAGVFEIFEIAGWDLILAIWPYLIPYIENSIETPSLLQEKVDTGELGLKTEKGFYDWTPESSEALKKRLSDALIKIAQWS
ncbi:3-hydroxyacyl-CoA dehydrogenase family protein [Okeania sp. SIO2C2]|uniref:3-hydroxyacyl-CoA dehydrogenase family protein n=1 Tax=Okeania sp. SIO2C2 TaxID=2607787 RepID=UPI00257F3BCD|nr:3-hydroxyacyl-CoA dehydrogenase family protein [Okeania sp. SIO2C2]